MAESLISASGHANEIITHAGHTYVCLELEDGDDCEGGVLVGHYNVSAAPLYGMRHLRRATVHHKVPHLHAAVALVCEPERRARRFKRGQPALMQ